MKSSAGYLKKILSIFRRPLTFSISVTATAVLLLNIINSPEINAQTEQVQTTSVAAYSLSTSGDLNISLRQRLSNTSDTAIVVKYYTATVPFSTVKELEVAGPSRQLEHSKTEQANLTQIRIDLKDEPLSKNNPIDLEITFVVPKFIPENAQLKSLTLPVLFSGSKTEKALITVPTKLGKVSQVLNSDSNINVTQDQSSITVNNPVNQEIRLIFEGSVGYKFSIKKVLNNPNDTKRIAEVPIPKPHFNQEIFISSVLPVPDKSLKDKDDNIFLLYTLEPNEQKIIGVEGTIVLKTGDNAEILVFPENQELIKQDSYWSLDSEIELKRFDLYLRKGGLLLDEIPTNVQIRSQKDKDLFYSLAQNYIIDRLNISPDFFAGETTLARSGASVSITKSSDLSTEDYSDLLVAILRKYKVPARMVLGYVTNESGNFEEGFFHNWVEYWDSSLGWQIADPSLKEASGYSVQTDTNIDHLSILVRGHSPISPKLNFIEGDVLDFTFTSDVPAALLTLEGDSQSDPVRIPDNTLEGQISIQNKGNKILEISDIRESDGFIVDFIPGTILVPGQKIEIEINKILPTGTLLDQTSRASSYKVTATTVKGGAQVEKEIRSDLKIETYWWWTPMIYLVSTLGYLLILSLLGLSLKTLRRKNNMSL